MSIDVTEAHGLEEFGVRFSDPSGNVTLYITGGTGSPVGTDAPVPTLYIDENNSIWRKFNTSTSDWMRLPEDRFVDKIYPDDVNVPSDKVLFLHDACFTTGNLIVGGEVVLV